MTSSLSLDVMAFRQFRRIVIDRASIPVVDHRLHQVGVPAGWDSLKKAAANDLGPVRQHRGRLEHLSPARRHEANRTRLLEGMDSPPGSRPIALPCLHQHRRGCLPGQSQTLQAPLLSGPTIKPSSPDRESPILPGARRRTQIVPFQARPPLLRLLRGRLRADLPNSANARLPVCTENLNPNVVMVKAAKHGA